MIKNIAQDEIVSNQIVKDTILKLSDLNLTNQQFIENLKILGENLQATRALGYSYLEPFIKNPELYPELQDYNHLAKMVVNRIIDQVPNQSQDPENIATEKAARKDLQKILENIAQGSMYSLTNQPLGANFTLGDNISIIVLTYTGSEQLSVDMDKVFKGAIRALNIARIDKKNSELIATKILNQYPIIIGILGENDSLHSAFAQDMCYIIANGSHSKGNENHAARYLKMQKFEQEVKKQVIEFAKENTLDTQKAKDFLKTKSIEGIEYLRSNYESGMILEQKSSVIKDRMDIFNKRINDIKNDREWQTLVVIPEIARPIDKVTNTQNNSINNYPWQKFVDYINKILEQVKNFLKPKTLSQKDDLSSYHHEEQNVKIFTPSNLVKPPLYDKNLNDIKGSLDISASQVDVLEKKLNFKPEKLKTPDSSK